MKKRVFFILLIAIAAVTIVQAQTGKSVKATKPCPAFVLNLDNGTLNNLKPTATQQQIKTKLPCFTGDTKNGSATNCGGGVFYLKDDVFFYTQLKAINIRKDFTGKMKMGGKAIELFGASKTTVEGWFNQAFSMTLEDDEANNYTLNFKTKWGTLTTVFVNGVVNELYLGYAHPDAFKICK